MAKRAMKRVSQPEERKYDKCDVCGKFHQYYEDVVVEYKGEQIKTQEIHSPCLDEIVKKALGVIDRVVR